MLVTLDLETYQSDASSRRTLSSLSLAVAKCKKIVVVTGAGVSCSCGIPDFRSSDGLYALVKQQYPDVILKGRDLFDASLFRDHTSTAVFYTFISQLKKSVDSASPSPTHRFIKTLDSKHKLLRSYTQNIDGLEERVGLLGSSNQEANLKGKGRSKLRMKDVRNVQLHGDIHRVRCTFCSAELPCTEDHLNQFSEGVAPPCPECTSRSKAREARSARKLMIGTLRPALVLYNEVHPLGDEIGAIQSVDITRGPEMLIIMGTSLKVHGFKKLVKDFAKSVHGSPSLSSPWKSKRGPKSWVGKVVYVNKTPPGSEWEGIIDYHVAGETDAWVEKVVEDWKKMRPSDWEIQKTLVAAGSEDVSSAFKVAKEVISPLEAKREHKAKPPSRENRPIFPDAIDPFFSSSKPLSAPTSHSKRRTSVSHYSGLEESPSKKIRTRKSESRLEPEERKLLFNTTNLRPITQEDPLIADTTFEELPEPKRSKGGQGKLEVVINVRVKKRKIRGSERGQQAMAT